MSRQPHVTVTGEFLGMQFTWENIADKPDIWEGDEDSEKTYAAVGKCLSKWENMEFSMSMLYSQFKGSKGKIEYFQEYGTSGKIFVDRLTSLERVAEAYFVPRPHQEFEASLALMVTAARRLAVRRNEIAHGIVAAIAVEPKEVKPDKDGWVPWPNRYFLAPPHHAFMKYGEDGQYYYGSKALEHFQEAFDLFNKSISKLANYLETSHGSIDRLRNAPG
jgi:hypothetical protein